LLELQFTNISAIYAGEFANMAETDVPLEELEAVMRDDQHKQVLDTLNEVLSA